MTERNNVNSYAVAPRAVYPALDLLRFFAALMVAFDHLVGSNTVQQGWSIYVNNPTEVRPYYTNVSAFWFVGFIGVQIFFSISGYIISVSATKSRSPLRFMEGRLLRIFPGLWLCTLMILPLCAAFAPVDLSGIALRTLRSVFLVPFGPYLDGVIWTIIVEMVFYSYTFLFLVLFGRNKLHRLGYALIIASALYWMLLASSNAVSDSQLFVQLGRRLVLEHGIFFGVGMVLAPRSNGRALSLLDLVMLAIGVAVGYYQIKISTDFVYSYGASTGATDNPAFAFVIWAVSVLMLYVSTKLVTAGMLKRDFGRIRKVGMMTYPLYLLHLTFGQFSFAMLSTKTDLPLWICTGLAIAIVIALAFLVALVLEPAVKRALAPAFDWLVTHIENKLPLRRRQAAAGQTTR